ncbi:MAG TPA: hypothetical protein VGL86_07130 [Polyangia bacterium]|jgi:hypothetical protein
MRAALPLAAIFLAMGCTRLDLSDAGLVDGLRLLGVQAEPPEAPAGASVTLTAWTADPNGGTIDVSWSACMLPSNGLANSGCTSDGGNGVVGLGSGATLSFVVPALDATLLGPPDGSFGVYLPIVVHLTDGADSVDGIYRLRVRVPSVVPPGCTFEAPYPAHCEPNQNPAFEQIEPIGPDDTMVNLVYANETWGFLADYDGASSEEYAIPGSLEPTAFERLTTQWFATGGLFPNAPVGGTGVQGWTLQGTIPPVGGTIDLWVVGHDDRGGTAMTHRTFVMQ